MRRVRENQLTVESHRARDSVIGLAPRISIRASGRYTSRANRPDRRQHLTTCTEPIEDQLASTGASIDDRNPNGRRPRAGSGRRSRPGRGPPPGGIAHNGPRTPLSPCAATLGPSPGQARVTIPSGWAVARYARRSLTGDRRREDDQRRRAGIRPPARRPRTGFRTSRESKVAGCWINHGAARFNPC